MGAVSAGFDLRPGLRAYRAEAAGSRRSVVGRDRLPWRNQVPCHQAGAALVQFVDHQTRRPRCARIDSHSAPDVRM